MSPDDLELRIRYITPSFCEYFYHIWDALQRGQKIPHQVSVDIRVRFDRGYRTVWHKVKVAKSLKNGNLVKWISSLDGEKQGVALVALLEIEMNIEGSMRSYNLLHAVVMSIGQV